MYDRRDLIGHWVRKQQRAQQMCTHACCRGYRVHPQNYPVILPNPLLRRASDEDLAWHYEHAGSEKAEAQVLHELDRRDQADKRKQERKAAAHARLVGRRQERHEEVERVYYDAEQATNGYMLNRAGQNAVREGRLNDTELFTGHVSKVDRYASDELKEYFAEHGRPTAAYFRGERTTYYERAKARRPRYRVRARRVA